MFDPKHLNFKFPLFVTSTHMLVQFSLSSLVLFAFPHLRPAGFGTMQSHHHHHHHHHHHTREDTPRTPRSEERRKQQAGEMTPWFYLTRISPCGIATGLDIGLGNMS